MQDNNQNADQGKKIADFIGKADPITNILILWMIKEVEPKTLFLKYLPEMPEELKRLVNISDRMEVVMNYFCGNMNGKFLTGFYASNPRDQGEMGIAIDNTSKHNNLFIMYRAIRALKYFSRIDYPDDMIRITHAFNPLDKDHVKDKEWLIGIINKNRYDEIAKDIPPELENAVDALMLKGVAVDKDPFETEIKRGLISSRSLMKTLKIPTPEEERERIVRLERLIKPYWECAVHYLGYKKYPVIGNEVVSKLKKNIYEAIARGIESHNDAVAIAMIVYYREKYAEINKPTITKDAKLIEKEKKAFSEAEYRIIKEISEEFAECFKKESQKPEELFRRYDSYLKNMNIVEPVDLLG